MRLRELDSIKRKEMNKEGSGEEVFGVPLYFFNQSKPFNYFTKSNGIFLMVHR
jgi:hypothetical protein